MKFFVYFFPVLINFVTSGVFFYVTQCFVDANASKLLTSLVVPMWAAAYCMMNVIIGKVVNKKNAAGLIIFGGILISVSSLGFLFLGTLKLLLVWTGLLGIGFGFYCSPFQVLCKELEQGSSSAVAMATGKYTAAWSIGFAAGAIVFGMLSAQIAFWLSFASGVMVSLGVAFIAAVLKKRPAAKAEMFDEADEPEGKVVFPDYAWLGWIVGGVLSFSVTQLRSMLQPHAAAIGMANAERSMAIVLMLVSLTQGVIALLLVKSRFWMYKLPMVLFGICGVVAMTMFCLAESLWSFMLSAVCYGIYSGCGYFIFVFYSLAHPVKAGRNAAVNEIVVAVASISGPMLGGLLVIKSGMSWAPFAMAGVCILLATLFHFIVFKTDRRRQAALAMEENCNE